MTPGDTRALVGQRLGAYQIEALLPIGGLPECFRARHLEAGHEVAVKLLPGTLVGGRDTLTALRNETRHISALKHPNILPIYGIAETEGILYAVTPLPTESLRDQLNREGVLPAVHAVRLAAQLAWALHALHGIGLIHGDVHPGTLLFDASSTLQVADFCVARALARQRGRRSRVASRTWPLAGARTYVAPEAAQTGEISVRADIYALGAVLYEMLIGTLPLQQAMLGEPELVTAPLPPSMRSSDTWPELAAVALRALDRDPAKRYPDARAFAIALRRAVIAEPEAPREPSLRDALVGVWHPEVDEAAATAEAEAFKRRLTMPPAPTTSQPAEPSFKERLATAPPTPQFRPSIPPVVPPSVRPAPAPPASPPSPAAPPPVQQPSAAFVPPRNEDYIGTTLLPDRSALTGARPPEDDIATTLLPDRAAIKPEQPPARPVTPSMPSTPPLVFASPMAPSPLPPPSLPPTPAPPAWQSAHPPLRLPLEPRPPTMEPPPDSPPAFYDDTEYVTPEELAQALAGHRPGPARRLTAAVAGIALLLAFGAGTVGILTGFGRGATASPPSAQPTVTTTSAHAPATVTTTIHPTVTQHAHAATIPPPTATPRPTATATPHATP